jgi:hypothetical protein
MRRMGYAEFLLRLSLFAGANLVNFGGSDIPTAITLIAVLFLDQLLGCHLQILDSRNCAADDLQEASFLIAPTSFRPI